MSENPEERPTRINITIYPKDAEKLKEITPKNTVSDGIRVALKESTQYRRERVALEKLRSEQNEY